MHHPIRGAVSVSWRLQDGRFVMDVELPPNMTATVIVPEASESTVTEGGTPVRASPGVRTARTRAGSL